MEKLLILPNYSQNDNLFILAYKNKEWVIESYDLINRLNLPKSCNRGLPNFLLSTYTKDLSFVLGQVCRYKNHYLILKSCVAGTDHNHRSVFVTSLIEKENLENESICIDNFENIIQSNKNYIINDTEIDELKKAINLLNNPSENSKEQIKKMYQNINDTTLRYQHFTSVSFKEAAYPPDSERFFYKKKKKYSKEIC